MAVNRSRFAPRLVVDNPPCVIVPRGELASAEEMQIASLPRVPASGEPPMRHPYRDRCEWMQREADQYLARQRRRRRRPLIVAALLLATGLFLVARAVAP